MKSRSAIFAGLFALLILASCLSLLVGPTRLSLRDIFHPQGASVLFSLRLPRLLLGILAGAVLAMSGGAFQGVLRNPLADPYVLGVSSGAAFGAAVALALGLGPVLMPLLAVAGALATLFLVYTLARIGGRLPTDTLLLAGVIMGYFFASLLMLVMAVSRRELREIVFILFGNLGVVFTSRTLLLFEVTSLVTIACLLVVWWHWRDLNALALGEEVAESLGVAVDTVKKTLFIACSVAVAGVVALAGSIGFVGFVVPHIARMLLGPNHREVLPASLLLGATLLVLSDILARSIAPMELPVGIVTSLLGVPFFVYLLQKRKRAR
jgi:iron complex transport system permease protein